MSDTPRVDAVVADAPDALWSWPDICHLARQLERELNAAQKRISELESIPAITIAAIQAHIAHITENGLSLTQLGQQMGDAQTIDEGRCRELCASYLREWIITKKMSDELKQIERELNAGQARIKHLEDCVRRLSEPA